MGTLKGGLHLHFHGRQWVGSSASTQAPAIYSLKNPSSSSWDSGLSWTNNKLRITVTQTSSLKFTPLFKGGFKCKKTGDVVQVKAFDPTAEESIRGQVVLLAHRLKIGMYFVTWWALGVAFNIYNKKVLNVFPYPLLTSTLALLAGSAIMFFSWASGIVDVPQTDGEFWRGLFPVAVAHSIGQVGTTVSMSKNDVSFTHVIKSAEPAFSVIFSRFFLGENFSPALYISLLPIIGGCALAAVTELNFNTIGFVGAMVSNIAFVMRNSLAKRTMKGKGVSGMNYYACLTIFSLAILTPFACIVEGPKLWNEGWLIAVQRVPAPQLLWWLAAQSVLYHLYNQVSYMSLDEISPLTFSIGNTMKRVAIIVSSVVIFQTRVMPLNAVGAGVAIAGTFLYSQVGR